LSVDLSREDGVAVLTVNRPDALNAFDVDTLTELRDHLRQLAEESEVRAVVLTGAGERAFAAGADIKYMSGLEVDQAKEWGRLGHEVGYLLETMPKPTIAAVNGFALGGGCEVALACDLRLAAEDARFALPEVKLGVLPGSGGLYRLPELVGPARALELMYLGEPISAGEAESMGLLNRVVPKGRALEHSIALAREIARRPRDAVAAIKRGVRGSSGVSRAEAVRLTLELSERVFMTDDAVEGYEAFVEKREPRFSGMG
jgi:enoyl-CoA hydratase